MDITTIRTKEDILSDNTLIEVFDIEDEIERERTIICLSEKAKVMNCKTEFMAMVKVYKDVLKKASKVNAKKQMMPSENYTQFDCPKVNQEYFSGNWIADYDGIRTFSMFGEILACYHPILPIRRLSNMETGEEQIVLAYYRNNMWKEIKVPKAVISSANKITQLSNYGISVTSENAKYLVKYLSDIENMNEAIIDIQSSTAKIGWNGEQFIPYDSDVEFDGDIRFKALFNSIHEKGSYDKWFEHVKKLRATGRTEIKFMIATSLASILVGKFKALPFIVDLWGFTENGKSVSLMLACSVWANPDESQYIGDFKTTDVALEAKADMLNSLPMLLDDTSQTSSRVRDNFEGIVYQLCSGKGKSRSNKELGMNRENHWKNCFITNGERPLNSYVNQGGAINRILEVECSEKIFDNPQETAGILKDNYGFCGRMFVDIIKGMEYAELEAIRRTFQEKLISEKTMQKQAISLSMILTADKIAEEFIFKDGVTIGIDEAKKVLSSMEEVSDNQRCYEYLMDKVNMNENRFNPLVENIEKWGTTENSYVIFFTQAFHDLCKTGGFNSKSFLSWASKNGLIDGKNGATKVKKINGKSIRCICLKMEHVPPEKEENVVIDDMDLPFV